MKLGFGLYRHMLTLGEMNGGGNVYDAVDEYSKQGRIAYVHLRNVRGKVPDYK